MVKHSRKRRRARVNSGRASASTKGVRSIKVVTLLPGINLGERGPTILRHLDYRIWAPHGVASNPSPPLRDPTLLRGGLA